MSSSDIFSLATSKEELSSINDGVSRRSYSKLAPSRDVTDHNFSNGQISFKFETSGVKRWIPSESYIRMRVELLKGDSTTPIDLDFGAAPNMAFCANLFSSGEMRINNTTVSRIEDYMPQIDALETRMNKSKSWVDSLGYSSNWYQVSQTDRLNEVASDAKTLHEERGAKIITSNDDLGLGGTATVAFAQASPDIDSAARITFNGGIAATNQVFRVGDIVRFTGLETTRTGALGVDMRVLAVYGVAHMDVSADIVTNINAHQNNTIERVRYTDERRGCSKFGVSWQPPLSLFKCDKALPAGRFELVLNPQSASGYQQRAIESILGQASKNAQLQGAVADAANIRVKVVDMYLYAAMIDAERVENLTYLLDLDTTQCQADSINTASFGQKSFTVSPSTTALTVAYQDSRAGVNTALSASKFKSYEAGATPSVSQELNLERFFINYAGQSRPESDADPSFVVGSTDYMQQLYLQTQMEVGAYHDMGGAEDIKDWQERGPYYTLKFPRDATDRSTAVNVHQGFTGATDVTDMRVLLFSHAKQVLMVTVEEGQTTRVVLEDA